MEIGPQPKCKLSTRTQKRTGEPRSGLPSFLLHRKAEDQFPTRTLKRVTRRVKRTFLPTTARSTTGSLKCGFDDLDEEPTHRSLLKCDFLHTSGCLFSSRSPK